jgi:soluble lytic murein transglycosylase-like protein
MTASAKPRSRKPTPTPIPMAEPGEWQRVLLRYLPGWIALAVALTIFLPNAVTAIFNPVGETLTGTTYIIEGVVNGGRSSATLAPLFTEQVDRWAEDIRRWAYQYNLDPNLMATVMQIESCGQSTVSSSAGAQGLFQVMPFHFSDNEVQTDPDTNAKRSAGVLQECLGWADGDVGLALACYNGGPSVTTRPFSTWPNETQRYYNWGTGIYNDAKNNLSESQTLNTWLDAGGIYLCDPNAGAR